jgi:GxxExxY protein
MKTPNRVLFSEMSHGFSGISTDNPQPLIVNFSVMDMQVDTLKHSKLTEKMIGVFYDVYNELGYGFLESTYAEAMVIALQDAGLMVAREVPVSVWFRGRKAAQYFADLLVEGRVLLELKCARTIDSAHEAQLLHYLRATEIEVGLLLNFGMRPQFRRLLFDNERKKIRENPCESVAKVYS